MKVATEMHSALNKVVSHDSDELILVDSDDNEIGSLNKADCHDGDGILHRAFSLFIFNSQGEILLQQRGADKRLWPMYWSNSCCSHPRHGEDMQTATARRLSEELGISAELEFVYKFSYQANFDGSGSENELCWVFLGHCDELPRPNQTEIAAARFVRVDQLEAELESRPRDFTPWFKMEWQCLRGEHHERVEKYTS